MIVAEGGRKEMLTKEDGRLSRTSLQSTQQSPSQDKQSVAGKDSAAVRSDTEEESLNQSQIFQKDIDDTVAEINWLAETVLNSRKVYFANEIDGATNIMKVSSSALKNNMDFELSNKDKHERSILHRVAYDQQANQMNDVLIALNSFDPQKKQEIIESKDQYGNSALILTCIRNCQKNKKQQEEQLQVVRLLLNDKAKPNVQNNLTSFTALHWACINGAIDIVKILLDHQAMPFVPDVLGFFPIDYAGLFKHDETVSLLIRHHFTTINTVNQSINKMIQEYSLRMVDMGAGGGGGPPKMSVGVKPGMRSALDNQNQRMAEKAWWESYLSNDHLVKLLQFNPIYNTNMLYWAALFNSIPIDLLSLLLKSDLEAYPEGPVSIDNWRTPIHAAASVGNEKKLKLLLDDVSQRYINNSGRVGFIDQSEIAVGNQSINFQQTNKYRRKNMCINIDTYCEALFKSSRGKFSKIQKFNEETFAPKLELYAKRAEATHEENALMMSGIRMVEEEKFTFDFLDKKLNSPLHIASQNGSASCLRLLLNEYNLKIDLRNIDGWMAKDIVQHENIRQAYNEHYDKVKNSIKQSTLAASAPKEGSQAYKGQRSGVQNDQENQIQADKLLLQQEVSMNERNRVTKQLLLCRDYMPQIPLLIVKVNLPYENQNNSEVVNNMIEQLINQKFQIQMFPSLEADPFKRLLQIFTCKPSTQVGEVYYIALKLEQSQIEMDAKEFEIRMKMCNADSQRAFQPIQKGLFEPFRSKDIAQIMLLKLNKILNIQQLKKSNILLSIIPMHDLFGMHEIKTHWWRNTEESKLQSRRCRWCRRSLIPMPLPMISLFFKESMNFSFSELSSIKNYFGEKIAFYYAWMTYYTVWLIFPAIGGLAITIYQFAFLRSVDTIFTSLYCLLVCIWVTIFIERWKRKSSEICLKWGLSDLARNRETRMMRPEFIGYEFFSLETHRTEKITYKPYKALLFSIMQIPIFLTLIACCVLSFLAQQNVSFFSTGISTIDNYLPAIAGVVNGIFIAIFDQLYSFFASTFVDIENHKYSDSYEKSYVFKMFLFKFVNTNLSILYTAFGQVNENADQKRWTKLYYLILGMAVTKSVQILLLKNVKKYLLFRIKYWWYFREIKKKGSEQKIQHASYMGEIQDRQNYQESIEAKRFNAIKQLAIFSGLDEILFPIYQRMVMNSGKNIETDHIMTDFVELNDLMPERSEVQKINEISDVFILFGLATLYACACPIVPVIAICHNIIDINMDLYMNCTTTRRPIAQVANNIDPWLIIAEFMAIAAVLSNCLLLYFSTPTLRSWVETQMGAASYQEVYLLWIIVGVEHAIIIIKQICAEVIPDVPGWVQKSQELVKREKKKLQLDDIEADKKKFVGIIKEKLDNQNSKRRLQVEELSTMITQINRTIKEKNVKIEKLEKEKADALKQIKQQDQKQSHVQVVEKAKEPGKLALSDYLEISPSEWLAKGRTQELDKALNKNLQRRLMYQSFLALEKEILSKRIGKLFDTKISSSEANNLLSGGLQIICAECQTNMSTIECIDCQDHYCKACCDALHSSNPEIFKNHKMTQLNVQVAQGQNKWKKFEYFHFPVLADNEPYSNVQLVFFFFKSRYLDMNYIEDQNAKGLGGGVNLQSLFIDRQYDLLTDLQAKAMMTRDKRIFGGQEASTEQQDQEMQMLQSKASFNDEELFYINKIAYYLFVNKHHNLTFAQFTKTLGVLQSAPILQRVTLWVTIMSEEYRNFPGRASVSNEEQEDFVSRAQIEETFKFSFLQRRPMAQVPAGSSKSYKDITQIIFKDIPAPAHPSGHQLISTGKFIEVVTKNDEVRDFMSCLLQFKPLQNNFVQP